MSLSNTPSASRIHIGIFGCRNAGKSSLINAITGQEISLVSDTAGTTTDPVSKAMELLPLGPVVFIDTAGLDDEGELGSQRVRRSMQILEKIDIALIVVDNRKGFGEIEKDLIKKLRARRINYLIVYNHFELTKDIPQLRECEIGVNVFTGENIQELKNRIAQMTPLTPPVPPLVADLLTPGDVVILVTPIDSSAPKERLILPQQQTIRDILDADAQVFVTKESSLSHTLDTLTRPPRLVITDSQVFKQVAAQTPDTVPLTSFSILFARRKGILEPAVDALSTLNTLKDGDKVLISEACTHHRQCGDIGTIKLPKWIRQYTQRDIQFEFTSGGSFPEDLGSYQLIVHCGSCMINERAMHHRLQTAREQRVPMTNYGILIAYMNGILERSIAPFQ